MFSKPLDVFFAAVQFIVALVLLFGTQLPSSIVTAMAVLLVISGILDLLMWRRTSLKP